jgi:DNA-binding CsgD family transcriptional regulator/PAS domain-containing protein
VTRHWGSSYDDESVKDIVDHLAAAIDGIALGSADWDIVPGVMGQAFPGTFSGVWNLNFAENRLNGQAWTDIDPDFARSYAAHFAYINPWTDYWIAARSGHVALSEAVFPSRSFAHTEFYNDWLRPQPGSEAAAGLKLTGDSGELFQLVTHFSLDAAGRYDAAIAAVMTRMRPALQRQIDLARRLRDGVERAAAGAALVRRSRCAAFVVDRQARVIEANAEAEALFAAPTVVTTRHGRCRFANAEVQALLLDLIIRDAGSEGRIMLRNVDAVWQVIVAPIPVAPPMMAGDRLLPPRQHFLIMIDRPGVPHVPGDLSALGRMFGLTLAEIALCRRLILGDTLAEAAAALGLATETVRTRIKTIFAKTGTARQSQLLLLLSRL